MKRSPFLPSQPASRITAVVKAQIINHLFLENARTKYSKKTLFPDGFQHGCYICAVFFGGAAIDNITDKEKQGGFKGL